MAVMACYCVIYVLTQSTHWGEQLNGWNSRCHKLQAGLRGGGWTDSVQILGSKIWPGNPMQMHDNWRTQKLQTFYKKKRIVYSHLEITTVIIFATLIVTLYAHTEAVHTYPYLQKCRYTYFTACFFPIKKILWIYIHLFRMYLLSICYVPGTIPGMEICEEKRKFQT